MVEVEGVCGEGKDDICGENGASKEVGTDWRVVLFY